MLKHINACKSMFYNTREREVILVSIRLSLESRSLLKEHTMSINEIHFIFYAMTKTRKLSLSMLTPTAELLMHCTFYQIKMILLITIDFFHVIYPIKCQTLKRYLLVKCENQTQQENKDFVLKIFTHLKTNVIIS